MRPSRPTSATFRLTAIVLAVAIAAGLAFAGMRLVSAQRVRHHQADARLQQQAGVGAQLLSSSLAVSESSLAARYSGRLAHGRPSRALLDDVVRQSGASWARLSGADGDTVAATDKAPAATPQDARDQPYAATTLPRTGRRPAVVYAIVMGQRVLRLGFERFHGDQLMRILARLPGARTADLYMVGADGEVIAGLSAAGRALDTPPLTLQQLRDAGKIPAHEGGAVTGVARVEHTPWSFVARVDGDAARADSSGPGALLAWLLLAAAAAAAGLVLWLMVRAHRNAEVLEHERERALAVLSVLDDGFLFMRAGHVVDANDRLCELVGVSASELIGADAGHPLVAALLAAEELPGTDFETALIRPDGTTVDVAIATHGLPGTADGHVSVVRDIAAQKREERRLAHLASTDALTGLANRGAFDHALAEQRALARLDGRELSLVLFDVDHFKAVNDEHGHPAGDRTLVELVRRLTDATREGDLLARIGGEEFAWLLPHCPLDVAETLADRARCGAAAQPIAGVGHVTLSAGVAQLRDDDPAGLYAAADAALLLAKRSGRDRTVAAPSSARELAR